MEVLEVDTSNTKDSFFDSLSFIEKYTLGVERYATFLPFLTICPIKNSIVFFENQY